MFVSIRCFTLVILFIAGSLRCAQILPHGSAWRYFKGFSEASAPDPAAWLELALETSADEEPPRVTRVVPRPGSTLPSLSSIEILFNEPIAGLDAADLLINGIPATLVSEPAPGQYLFEFDAVTAGTAILGWRADHGLADFANQPFIDNLGPLAYTIDANVAAPALMISEFMADNERTLNDDEGDSSDWIEIHNPTDFPLDLAGWHLTDAPTNLTKWRFPPVQILERGFLLLFASGKDHTNAAARLHANFRLERNGGWLALINPAGKVISEFAYPAQRKDVSYGRDLLTGSFTGYFVAPTPNAPNAASGPGFSPAVEFSRPAGTFLTPFALELMAPSNAPIYFTLDGTAPTEFSERYTLPIQISTSAQVRVRAFVPGLLPGPPASATYLELSPTVTNFVSDLPVLVIHNFGFGGFSANARKFAAIQIFAPANGSASLTGVPDLTTRASLKIRGSSTQGLPKSSYAVEFWDEFDQDRDLGPLGLPADSDWILYAPNSYEPVLIHNPFIFELSNQIGRYAVRTRFVEVYQNTAGGPIASANYRGIYVLMEKIKRGPDRVDIANLEPEHNTPPRVTGGYMLKIDRLDPGDGGLFGAGQSMGYVDPKEIEIETPQRDPQEQYIRGHMNAFGAALNSPGFTNASAGYAQWIDAPAWIDHHILNVFAFNVDALRLSTYLYKDREGKIAFGPIWDFDRALGSTDGRDANPRVWRSLTGDRGTDFFNYPWWGRLFRDPQFFQLWIDRWQELRRDRFSTNNLFAIIDGFANQVRAAQPRERARWAVAPRGGSYQAEVNLMKTWLSNRIHFIDTNFLAAPVLSDTGTAFRPGQKLSLAAPTNATIYYTLDGTDPRTPAGQVAPTARAYDGPITLSAAVRLKARAFNANHRNLTGANNPPISSPWSGPINATFDNGPDADSDSLPDEWEISYGLAHDSADGVNGAQGDPDGDGLSNADEYLSGTHPRDPASVLRLTAQAGPTGGIRLKFNGTARRSYSVEYRDEMPASAWTVLTNFWGRPASFIGEIRDYPAGVNESRLYRLVTPSNQ